MTDFIRRAVRSESFLPIFCAAVVMMMPVRRTSAQDVGLIYATNDDAKTQAFARRGLAIDMASPVPYMSIDTTNRSAEVFREVAPEVLVRTYDSLQPGAGLRAEVDRLLRISGDSLESINFVLIDDVGGLRPKDTEGVASIEEKGKRFIWPATNLWAWLDRQDTTFVPGEPVDKTLTIYTDEDLDPKKRADELNWEADFRDQTADILEKLYADASENLLALRNSISETAGVKVRKEDVLADLKSQLAGTSAALEATAKQAEIYRKTNEQLKVARQVAAVRGIPLFVPDLPTFEEELGTQMDELGRLITESEAADADLKPVQDRLAAFRLRRVQLVNEMERWKREANEDRKMAEIMRRRADGVLSGELNLADYRLGKDSVKTVSGWSYQADVILGATMANHFVETLGDWAAWEGIILHRTLNTQLLSKDQIYWKNGDFGDQVDIPFLMKLGWSEVGFVGEGFDEADLSTEPFQAVENGLGIFLTARRSPGVRKKVNAFFDKEGPKYVFPMDSTLRSGVPDAITGRFVGGMTDFGSLKGPVDQRSAATGTVKVGRLRWEDVPAEYLLRSSATVTGFLLMIAAGWSDGSLVMNPLYKFCTDHWDRLVGRDLPSVVRRMSTALENDGFTWRPTDEEVKSAAGLMPLAYLDVLTNFGLSRSDVYPPGSEDDGEPSMADEYWSLIRYGLRDGLDRHGLFLGGSNLELITQTTDAFLVCATKFVGDQGSDTPGGLVDTCWPESLE